MYLQKEIIPRLSQEILFDIREKNLIYTNKKHIRVIEINIGLILLNIWSFNKIIDYDIYKIISKKKISLEKFTKVRQNISNTWIHLENKNSLYFISLKIMSLILTSAHIDYVNVDNHAIQNSVVKILKQHLIISSNVNNILASKINAFQRGSLEWELVHSRLAFLEAYKE